MTAVTETGGTAPQRPPYLLGLAVFVVVLAGYLWTLAPTVTFWDAGEFIAAAKILGIPHPPGTPLFVLLGNVWGTLVPIAEFAYRTNLMTALFSAGAAALFALLVVQALRGWRVGRDADAVDPVFAVGGALAAALAAAFVFTVWQNSVETEVYMVATFSIAAVSWLAWLWRQHRGGERAPHLLLLIVFLQAVSIGNHLLTLLTGPALLGFMWHVLRTEPLPEERDRQTEWAQWAILVGVWALLVGVGLGSTGLSIVGGLVFVVATAYSAYVGALTFALTVLAIAAVGASTYGFLYVRAKVGPFLNEADPSTLKNLWAVISREQYPPRSPLDNPIYTMRSVSSIDKLGAFLGCLFDFVDGPAPAEASFGVPRCFTVRSIPLILRQFQNYLQYFDWQWANGLAPFEPVFARIRLPFTISFIGIGVYGATVLRRRDRSVFWLLLLLFLTTGPALVGYMNFKPGFSLAWDLYQDIEMHEVRERDYFFTVSFLVWGLFVGIGLAGAYAELRDRLGAAARGVTRWAPASILAVALVPFAFNFRAASRAHGPEAKLARDFAYDLLQSVEPYGIVFTNGDNDTFPLWYLQEVEEVRQDVSVVNLSLANTDWYVRQLRDNPVRDFRPEQAPWYASLAPATKPGPLHSLTDADIEGFSSTVLGSELTFRAGRVTVTYPKDSPFYVYDLVILRLIQENWRQRPIYFSMTAGSQNWAAMRDYVVQHGLVFRLYPDSEPDSSRLAPGLFQVPMDVPRSDSLMWDIYRYAGLLSQDSVRLDPTNRNIAINLSYPHYGLGWAYETRGDGERAERNLRRGLQLHYLPEVARALDSGISVFTPPARRGDSAPQR